MSNLNDETITTNNHATNTEGVEHTITNMEKYENYKTQFERLTLAMNNHFYLEAIFIEYAIIEDRTTSILRYEGNEIHDNGHVSLDKKLKKIARLARQNTANTPWIARYFSDDNSHQLINKIKCWKDKNRNPLTHKLMTIITTTKGLQDIAEEGECLCKELSNQATNYKRMVERHKSSSL